MRVVLDATGILRVINHAPVIPPGDLAQLTDRFARSNGTAEGSGLGLAIVRTIADRADAQLTLHFPAPGHSDGVEVRLDLS